MAETDLLLPTPSNFTPAAILSPDALIPLPVPPCERLCSECSCSHSPQTPLQQAVTYLTWQNLLLVYAFGNVSFAIALLGNALLSYVNSYTILALLGALSLAVLLSTAIWVPRESRWYSILVIFDALFVSGTVAFAEYTFQFDLSWVLRISAIFFGAISVYFDNIIVGLLFGGTYVDILGHTTLATPLRLLLSIGSPKTPYLSGLAASGVLIGGGYAILLVLMGNTTLHSLSLLRPLRLGELWLAPLVGELSLISLSMWWNTGSVVDYLAINFVVCVMLAACAWAGAAFQIAELRGIGWAMVFLYLAAKPFDFPADFDLYYPFAFFVSAAVLLAGYRNSSQLAAMIPHWRPEPVLNPDIARYVSYGVSVFIVIHTLVDVPKYV